MGRSIRMAAIPLALLFLHSAWGDSETASAGGGHSSSSSHVEAAEAELPAQNEAWNIWDFLHAHRGRWAYLDDVHVGTFGELIGKPTRGIGAIGAMRVYQYDDGLLLCASEDMPALSMKKYDRFTHVDPGGQVTLLISDPLVVPQLSSMPRRWPVSLQDGRPRALTPGEILFSATPNYSTDADPPPAENTGWVMPGINGTLIVPLPGDPRPENVVWVVPKADGGFDLVWGGPRRRGELLMRVARTGEVTLGENTPYRLETRRGGTKRWVLSRDGVAVMIPPGHCMGPLTDGMSAAWISEDGEIHWTFTRY